MDSLNRALELLYLDRVPEAQLEFAHCSRCSELSAYDPLVTHNLGVCLMLQGHTERALQTFGSNVRRHTKYLPSYNATALLLYRDGRLRPALDVLEAAMVQAWHPQTLYLMSAVKKQLGDLDGAASAYSLAAFTSVKTSAHSTVHALRAYSDGGDGQIYVMHDRAATFLELLYCESLTGDTVMKLHLMCSPPVQRRSLTPPSGRKIAFVSEHFCSGSISSNFLPLLRNLGADTRCIDCGEQPGDDTTATIQTISDLVRASDCTPEHAVAGCDVLIDLDGYTGSLRSLAFLTAATDQVSLVTATHIGYPHSTGHARVQHRILDMECNGGAWSETVHHMSPCFLCWAPPLNFTPQDKTARRGLRILANHNSAKLSRSTLDMYDAVLEGCPDVEIWLKSTGPADPIRPMRTRMHVQQPHVELQDYYHYISDFDVALDALPYNGTVTTLECLYCDVPVLSVVGTVHRSQVGRSILHAVGLPQLVCSSTEELVAKVQRFQENPALRPRPRDLLLKSCIMDYDAYGAGFRAVVDEMRADNLYRSDSCRDCLPVLGRGV